MDDREPREMALSDGTRVMVYAHGGIDVMIDGKWRSITSNVETSAALAEIAYDAADSAEEQS